MINKVKVEAARQNYKFDAKFSSCACSRSLRCRRNTKMISSRSKSSTCSTQTTFGSGESHNCIYCLALSCIRSICWYLNIFQPSCNSKTCGWADSWYGDHCQPKGDQPYLERYSQKIWKFSMTSVMRRRTAPPSVMALFPINSFALFFSSPIESYIYERDFTLGPKNISFKFSYNWFMLRLLWPLTAN